MQNPFPWGKCDVLFLALPVCLLSLVYTGPKSSGLVSQNHAARLASQQQGSPQHIRQGRVQDWSTRHALYPQVGTMAAIEAARRDPRSSFRWNELQQRIQQNRLQNAYRFPFWPRTPRAPRHPMVSSIQRDWSIYIGTAGTAPAMFPAKFSFDTSAAPNCANDFVVYPVNTPGSAAQPSLVAFNNLYSGKIGATNGFCTGRTSGTGITDTKTLPTVLWSYNVSSAIAGAIATSPTLSLDGTKVAFVESITGKAAHFHVLAWKSGDGVTANLQNALAPKTLNTFSTTAPAAASGTLTDLALGLATTGSDTLSSPFIDYGRDQAYVGNDTGLVYRINNVFCVLASCGGAQPSIDATWGTAGTVDTTCAGKLTGPVLDFVTGNLYVGCADGKLYSISSAGVVKSLVVGDGTSKTYGGIVDPPLVDGLNAFVYVTTGSANTGANAVLVQAKMDLTSPVVANIGNGNQCNMHSPSPNNAYFTSITSAGALMYAGGLTATNTVNQPCNAGAGGSSHVALLGVTFGTAGKMNAGTPAHIQDLGPGKGFEFAPIAEFFNSTTGSDWLFISAQQSGQTNVAAANVATTFPTSFTLATEGVGTSGIIVDNAASATSFPQAASIYFNALQENVACNNNTNGGGTGGCAVKMTQSGLQ
jgi:hypothetical protein